MLVTVVCEPSSSSMCPIFGSLIPQTNRGVFVVCYMYSATRRLLTQTGCLIYTKRLKARACSHFESRCICSSWTLVQVYNWKYLISGGTQLC
ncbi:hypothetical protein ACROYT_G038759 [Oculina patagonica]